MVKKNQKTNWRKNCGCVCICLIAGLYVLIPRDIFHWDVNVWLTRGAMLVSFCPPSKGWFLSSARSHVPCQRQPSGTKRLPNIPLIFIGQQGQRGWLSGADVPLNPKSCPTVRDCEGKCEVSFKPCRLDVRINKFRADSVGFVKVGAPFTLSSKAPTPWDLKNCANNSIWKHSSLHCWVLWNQSHVFTSPSFIL